jgi:glutathione S-transferase
MPAPPTRFTLYSGPLSMFGAKVQIAALEKGLDFDLVMVSYGSQLGYSPKHPEVLRINPKGQVPVLVHGDLEIIERHGVSVTLNTPKLLEWRDRMTRRPAVRPVVSAMAAWLKLAGRPVPAFMSSATA